MVLSGVHLWPRASARPNYLLALLCLMAMSAILDRLVMTVLVGPIRADLGITDVQFGLLQGLAFGLFYAVLGVPIAYLADVSDRRRLIVAGLFAWSVTTIAGGLATSFAMLFVCRMFVGIGEASFNPAAYSLIADSFPRERLGRALGMLAGAFVMSIGLSVFISGGVSEWFNTHSHSLGPLSGLAPWRLTMIAVALPAPLLGLLLLATVREPTRPSDNSRSVPHWRAVWSELVANRCLLLLIIMGFSASNIHINAQLTWFPAYLIRHYGYSGSQVGLQFGGIAIVAGLLGPSLGGFASDMLHRRMGVKAPVLILICATCGAFIQALSPLAPTAQLAVLAFGLGYMVTTASIGLIATFIQMVCNPRTRARVSGVYAAASNLIGLSLGPLLVPLVVKQLFGGNPQAVGDGLMLVSVAVLLLALALFLAAFFTLSNRPSLGFVPTTVAAPKKDTLNGSLL